MKVKKINEKLELENSNDVVLQGCHNDCAEYFNKTYADYLFLKRNGIKVDKYSYQANVDAATLLGKYCYKDMTPKTCAFW